MEVQWCLFGNNAKNLEIESCTKWILVDSKGSMNPPDSPIATQFLFQNFLRFPVVNLMTFGEESGLVLMFSRRDSCA